MELKLLRDVCEAEFTLGKLFVNGEFDGEGALRVPVWPARWMIVFGSGLAGLTYLNLSLVELFGLSDKELHPE